MKKLLIYISLASVLLQVGCTKDFNNINTDPTRANAETFDPNYLLSESEFEFANTGYSQLLYQSMWPQVLASTYDYYSNGDKYKASGSIISYQDRLWNEDYRAASLAYDMSNLASSKGMTNLADIGVILKVLNLSHLTDCYGDIPYSQALQAKTAGVTQPAYDKQSDVYTSMLSDLESATADLSTSADVPSADLIYGGDIIKWKKFGYSLMLRLAMRLTKADISTAQTYAEKAVAGGVFTSTDDDALVKTDYSTGYGNNTVAALLVTDDFREVRWSKTFIDYLKSTNDPRLGVIAEVAPAGLANNVNKSLDGDSDPAIQIGLPNGYDLNGGATDIRSYAGYPGSTGGSGDVAPLGKYSRVKRGLYLNNSNPNFVLSYAEVELMLAEAKVRGWNVGSTTAAEHYANGVTAGMEALAEMNASYGTMDASDISTYVSANPLDMSSTDNSLKMINEQYWATTGSLMNFIETWCNWKRSGYPVLTPVNYPANFSSGTIPRRIPYQSSEPSDNPDNYAAAVAGLSNGDTYTSRIWWDQ